MSGKRRRKLELVYSNDTPVHVVEQDTADTGAQGDDPRAETQAIERFLSYLYEELHTLDKRQPAQLVGAAILALRDEAGTNGGGASRG